MTYAFYYDAPGNPAIYQLVGREIGDQEPDGMVLQVVTATDAGCDTSTFGSRASSGRCSVRGPSGPPFGQCSSGWAFRRPSPRRKSTRSTSLTSGAWDDDARSSLWAAKYPIRKLPSRARRWKRRTPTFCRFPYCSPRTQLMSAGQPVVTCLVDQVGWHRAEHSCKADRRSPAT